MSTSKKDCSISVKGMSVPGKKVYAKLLARRMDTRANSAIPKRENGRIARRTANLSVSSTSRQTVRDRWITNNRFSVTLRRVKERTCYPRQTSRSRRRREQTVCDRWIKKTRVVRRPRDGQGTHCCQHGAPLGYVDVLNPRCLSEHCSIINPPPGYDSLYNCFRRVFPTDPRTANIRAKTRELTVRDALVAWYGDAFIHNNHALRVRLRAPTKH